MVLILCIMLVKGIFIFELGNNEIEFGIGIYGELGWEWMGMKLVDEIVEMLVINIIEDVGYSWIVWEWDEVKGEW